MHKTLKQFTKAVAMPCKSTLLDASDLTETVAGLQPSEENSVLMAANPPSPPHHLQVIFSPRLEPIGSFAKLSLRAFNMAQTINKRLTGLSLIENIADLVPSIVTELETLSALKVDEKKSKEQKKSQAGHIQQRKRRALNDLFKTLQGLGLSYRYGLMTSSSGLDSSQELLTYLEPDQQPQGWGHLEKYFFR